MNTTTTQDEEMTMALDGLIKADAIRTLVSGAISRKAWRDATVTDALAFLQRDERKARRADVIAFVKAEFDRAGAGFSGRWQ